MTLHTSLITHHPSPIALYPSLITHPWIWNSTSKKKHTKPCTIWATRPDQLTPERFWDLLLNSKVKGSAVSWKHRGCLCSVGFPNETTAVIYSPQVPRFFGHGDSAMILAFRRSTRAPACKRIEAAENLPVKIASISGVAPLWWYETLLIKEVLLKQNFMEKRPKSSRCSLESEPKALKCYLKKQESSTKPFEKTFKTISVIRRPESMWHGNISYAESKRFQTAPFGAAWRTD